MPLLDMPNPVNLPLLRQELDEMGIIYRVQFGEVPRIEVDTVESSEVAMMVIRDHDASQMTADQAQTARDSAAQMAFLASVESATFAIGQMVVDTQTAIGRIQASALDETVKSELISMNMRTVALVQQLTPFIGQVISLIKSHTINN